ncbi:SusC/RagA family TonB-linked outer membrane protein [Terrimonas pollutisoli]|uniref:SusC/RagA family TonB-linked outer membrane protein n=1 Tax=Terrimonas pollutisoli TaxID=3034147 RepID=UPI0023EDE8E0|nr:SusC/RagA family TonB-linked outer membrane protein [Terrimonas sp. H1YJ31]
MRKIASLLAVLMLLCFFAFAQTTRTVKGVIRDDKGEPIPFATISEAGTKNATTADATGSFSIKVKEGAKLTVSATGFNTSTETPGAGDFVVSLAKKVGEMQEVVITTALGVAKTKKSLVYSTQTVNAAELNKVRATDISAALAGKVSGLQVLGTPSSNFGEGNVRIRGSASLEGGNPIYVVDGTVVNLGAINLDDVESLTVLKGPSATAIYGVRGSGGVILITTKKGTRKAPSVMINSLTEIGKVSLLPKYQNEYGGGYSQDWETFEFNPAVHPAEWAAFEGQKLVDYGADESWGPKMDGTPHRSAYSWYPGEKFGKLTPFSPQPNNVEDFYTNTLRLNNNVVFEGGGTNTTYRLSYNNRVTTLPYPNTRKEENIFSIKGAVDISPKLTASSNINFLNIKQKGDRTEGYTNDGQNISQNFNQWWQRQIDIKEQRDYINPAGGFKTWNIRSPIDSRPAYWDNVYYQVYESIRRRWQNRIYGDVNLTYKIIDNLKASVIFRANVLNNGGDGRIASGGLELDKYEIFNGQTAEYNGEFLIEYKKRFGNFGWEQFVGGNKRKDIRRENSANTVGGLSVPDLYSITASKDRPNVDNIWREYKINSLYARGTFDYKNFLFVDYSIRNDWSSALPEGENSYLYPSVGLSFVFTDLLAGSNVKRILNYGKLRAAYGRVGSDLDPYQLQATYGLGTPYGSSPTMNVPTTVFDPAIKPSLSSEYEFGTELQFFNSKLGVDFSWYRKDGIDQILPLTTTPSSGSSRVFINAGLIRSQGWDLIVNAKPFSGRDFQWNIQFNLAKNTSKVLDLDTTRNIRSYLLGSSSGNNQAAAFGPQVQSRVGDEWGTFIGTGYKIDEKSGLPIVNRDATSGLFTGFARQTSKNLGSALPDFTGGFLTSFSYKSFSASATFSFAKGGKFFSTTKMFLLYSGLHEETVGLNDKGNPVRNDPAAGGGVRLNAVNADGTAYTEYVDAQTYYGALQGVDDPFMLDASYVKMSEARVGYDIPMHKWVKTVKSLNVSLFVRNPWMIYSKTKKWGIDPSELENANAFYEGGQLPPVRSFGLNVSVGF